MNICQYCGASNQNDAHFCTGCGARLTPTVKENVVTPPKPQVDNTMQIIFSVIMITICLPFGIAALIVALNANNQPTQELALKKLALSNKLNIIGIVLLVVGVILYMLLIYIMISQISYYCFLF